MFIWSQTAHSSLFLVRSSSQAGLLAGSERSGTGGLPNVAGESCEKIGNRIYTAQGNLECITKQQNCAVAQGLHQFFFFGGGAVAFHTDFFFPEQALKNT